MPSKPIPVDAFVEGLRAIPAEAFDSERVLAYLQDNPVDPESLDPYLYFKPGAYTRNLIFKNRLFEVLALCWDVGKVSHVHNHCEQRCWMATPIGRLMVQNYRVTDGDPGGGYCRLEASTRYWMDPEHPAAVDPREPIHSVGNPPDAARGAVSIHIYSRPYDRCMVYSLERHEAREIPLAYDTEYGVRQT